MPPVKFKLAPWLVALSCHSHHLVVFSADKNITECISGTDLETNIVVKKRSSSVEDDIY